MENEVQGESQLIEKKSVGAKKIIGQIRAILNSKKTMVVLVTTLLVGSVFYFKSYFLVATIDGTPISRLSVIQRLEKQGGKSALDSIITEQLIEKEAKRQGLTVTNEEVAAEIKTIEASVAAQGGTLEEALAGQGLAMEDFQKSLRLQKALEKLLGDKIQVTEEEISQSLGDKSGIPAGKEEEIRKQIIDQLRSQKLNQEASRYIEELRSKTKIKYFVQY